jgi:hypothetical protein
VTEIKTSRYPTHMWTDGRVYYPLHAQPYTPAQAAALADRAKEAAFGCRAVVADCAYSVSDDWYLMAFQHSCQVAWELAGTGVFFSELFPGRVRGAGVGVAHNLGRGVAAFFPFIVGALSSVFGLKAAMDVGALGYPLVIVGVLALPETRGRQIA